MENDYKLSICIPTYNRAEFIGHTLANIFSQATDNVEVVIIDGASTDNTAKVVKEFQNLYKNIIYFKEEKNGGVDADLAKSVLFAHGEYCWLMSSDDFIADGAIQRILSEIKDGLDIYLCNRIECNGGMMPIRDRFWFSQKTDDRVFDFSKQAELLDYLRDARSIGALFSYMPTVIVRRANWMAVKGADIFFGTCYAHVFTLFTIVQNKCKLKYINSPPLILNRQENDCFAALGTVKRSLLDFNSYFRIGNRLFIDDDHARKAFFLVMTHEYPWYRILKLRSYVMNDFEWGKIRSLLSTFGYSRFILMSCGFLGRFRRLIHFTLNFKRVFKKI